MAGFSDKNSDSSGPSRYRYQSGLGHAPAYMVAGHPYLTGTLLAANKEFKVAFPFVAKRIVVAISGGDGPVRVSFRTQVADTDLDVAAAHHYFELDGDEESMTFQVKCKEIYIKNANPSTAAGFQLYAELTSIPTGNMYTLTGSGLSGGPAGGSGQTN